MILTDGTTAIELPDAMIEGEHTWQPVTQAISYSLNGSQFIDESVKKAGRPIDLFSEKDGYKAWPLRSTVDALELMASKPSQKLTLTRWGKTINVTFRHTDGPAVEAVPLMWYERDPEPDDYMLLTLRLITI